MVVPEGILIIWSDYRNGDRDIYGQIVTPEGNILWQENGLPLIVQVNDQDAFKLIYNDELYIVWQDFRSGTNYKIYVQKFNEDGIELWQEGGVLVAEVDEISLKRPDLVKVGNTIFIVWVERSSYWDENTKAQLVSENGELLWSSQGFTICDEFMDQDFPEVVSNGEEDVYITWQDGRATKYDPDQGLISINGIYAQKIHLGPTSAKDELVELIEILSNYPNPFNPSTTISFTLNSENSEDTEINIFNIKGQKIKKIEITNLKLGINQVIWNGKDENSLPVASGIYFYQLNVGDKVIASKKCLLLK